MEERSSKHFENCKEIFAELSAYLDAELPADACHEIEEHLANCQPCVEFLNTLQRTVELCRDYETGTAPGALSQSARQQLLTAYQRMLDARKR